nr:hypothetical protein [Marinicella sp. W31]MDC2876665.1 hypothetical protein [Marinicella sp. W31]
MDIYKIDQPVGEGFAFFLRECGGRRLHPPPWPVGVLADPELTFAIFTTTIGRRPDQAFQKALVFGMYPVKNTLTFGSRAVGKGLEVLIGGGNRERTQFKRNIGKRRKLGHRNGKFCLTQKIRIPCIPRQSGILVL